VDEGTSPADSTEQDVLDEDLVLDEVLVRASDLAKRYRTEMPAWVAAELTFGQVRLLFWLSNRGPTAMGVIGEWLGTSLPSVTGTIERLERHGLVERRHGADDRRIVKVHLTDAGNALTVDILGVRLEGIRRLLGCLDPTELRELDRLLRLIIERSGGNPS
jgi:DNA-binding MarR family transcriptional regulator